MELVNFEQYSDDFKWDYKLHFPVPTEKYIQNRSGGLPQGLDTEVEKLGFILNVTRGHQETIYSKIRWNITKSYGNIKLHMI